MYYYSFNYILWCVGFCMPCVLYVIGVNSDSVCVCIQWGKKVFSQPPIVQVLPLKKMREACNFDHRYTSSMTMINSLKILQGDFQNFFSNFVGQASLIFLSGRTCTIGG